MVGLRYNPYMKKNRFAGKSAGVLGLGREGISVALLLASLDAEVTVLDKDSAVKNRREAAELTKKGINFRGGRNYLDNLTSFDIIVRSPGVSLQLPEIKKAKRKNIEITSPTKLFFELSPTKKIIAVTGTKGKSTTASLIYHLLKTHLKKVHLAGNMGVSPLAMLPKLKATDTVVLELSSFQLEDLEQGPQIAVFLEIVPEHLDRHRTFAKYLAAKLNLATHQKKTDWLVVSKDLSSTKIVLRHSKARNLAVSEKQVLRRGVYLIGEEIVYRDVKTGKRHVVAKLSDIKLRGRHILANVLPAIAAAMLAGLPYAKVAKRLQGFKPLPNRLEIVREKDDVLFVNDSYATTPEAAAAGVGAFPDRPVALIAGGVHKGGDLRVVARAVKRETVVWVSLIGKSAGKFKATFAREQVKVPTKSFASFEEAIKTAYNKVQDNGVVLLSPACASFDMFKNATDRAEQFKKIVSKL